MTMKGKRNSLPSKHSQEEEAVDRISELPDNLIHEILSFIDMRYAVQTCVLSKRWKNVWKSLPYLSLDLKSFLVNGEISNLSETAVDRFVGFVDKVFEFRDDSDIQMLEMGFLIVTDTAAEALNRWIIAAVNCNLQELDITGSYFLHSAYEIPHQLLNCRSLKGLNIVLVGRSLGNVDIILPKSMSLPQIKELSLACIAISNLDLQRLFSSCPHMERVLIHSCVIKPNDQRNIIIDSHSLQDFALADNCHRQLGWADKVVTRTTKISAPNLKNFTCTGFMTEDFSLENLSSLAIAQLKMRLKEKEADESTGTYSELSAEEMEVFARRMMTLLGAVSNVHRLELSSGFLEVLLQAPGKLYRQPPQLCNLQILKLEMRFTRDCLRSIAFLLNISPTLTTLKLESKESNLEDVGDDWETEFSQTCMFSHLKLVEIREVEGCDNELKLLSFLLKKSLVLEKVNLFFRSTRDSLDNARQLRRFNRNLNALRTAFPSIQMQCF